MILQAFIFLLVQFSGVYLRYLPFSREITPDQSSKLIKCFLLWGVVDFGLNVLILSDGVTYQAYKIILLIDCWPYFIISARIISGKLPQHVFTFGMEGLWCFMLHAFGGMCVALVYGNMAEEFIPQQIAFYSILFCGLIKLERTFFINLLPSAKLFEEKNLRWCISLFPVVILLGTVISIAEVTFLLTWHERFSRLFFPVIFFIMYRSLSMVTKKIEEKTIEERKTRLLNGQMEELNEQNELMRRNSEEVTHLQQNLAETYSVIENLLSKGKKNEAMNFIRQQSDLLDATQLKMFCKEPLINAALSMYFGRAKELDIKTRCKVEIDSEQSRDESDLAVLLSNLLENAITACKKQNPPMSREINVIIRKIGGQNVLEVSNSYDYVVKTGENGLPYTTEIGHGLGMSSLELFAKKYNAYFDFNHENGVVTVSVYWSDHL